MLSVRTTIAAILSQSSTPLIISEITLPSELFYGQVLVEVITSGICGAQINEIDAVKGPDKFLPHLLGHEGLARVLEIGPGVRTVAPEDLVIMHWRPGAGIQSNPALYDWQGQKINAGWVTSFNQHAVVSENRVTRIAPREYDKTVLPLLGCALTTALGVLENDAKVNFRDSLLIFGGGGVGLLLVKLARLLGIEDITVVDIHDSKLEHARILGATKTLKFTNKDDARTKLNAINLGSLPSVAIDTTGNKDAIELCYEASSDTARVILVGVPRIGTKAQIYTLPLHFGKLLKGSHGGESKPEFDIPVLLDLISQKRLDFADYPKHVFNLCDINEGIDALRSGVGGRMIIDFTSHKIGG